MVSVTINERYDYNVVILNMNFSFFCHTRSIFQVVKNVAQIIETSFTILTSRNLDYSEVPKGKKNTGNSRYKEKQLNRQL